MVLGAEIMKIMYIIFLFLLAACSYASASKNIIDKASLFSHNFQIEEENGQCFLIHDAYREPLVPQPPCYFIRDSDQKPKYFSYSDVDIDAVLIVIGTLASDDMRMEWGLNDKHVCGTEAQGILIKKNDILVTKKVLTDGLLCRDTGADEKNFWEFAH